jgi:hypothetical protein
LEEPKLNRAISAVFGPGAETIFNNFAGIFQSRTQKAQATRLNGEFCCQITRNHADEQTMVMGAYSLKPTCNDHLFIIAEEDPTLRTYTVRHIAAQDGGPHTIQIRYNPTITGRQWKEIYGLLLRHCRDCHRIVHHSPPPHSRESIRLGVTFPSCFRRLYQETAFF